MAKSKPLCVVCLFGTIFRLLFLSGISCANSKCNCKNFNQQKVTANFAFSAIKYWFLVLQLLINITSFAVTTYNYGTNVITFSNSAFMRSTLTAVFAFQLRILALNQSARQIVKLNIYQEIFQRYKMNFELHDLSFLKKIVILLTGIFYLYIGAIILYGLYFLQFGSLNKFFFLTAIILSLFAVYGLGILKFFEFKLIQLMIQKCCKRLRNTLESKPHKLLCLRYTNIVIDHQYFFLSKRIPEFFNLYKMIMICVINVSSDFFLLFTAIYQTIVMIDTIFALSFKNLDIHIMEPLMSVGGTVFACAVLCVIAENIQKAVSIVNFFIIH